MHRGHSVRKSVWHAAQQDLRRAVHREIQIPTGSKCQKRKTGLHIQAETSSNSQGQAKAQLSTSADDGSYCTTRAEMSFWRALTHCNNNYTPGGWGGESNPLLSQLEKKIEVLAGSMLVPQGMSTLGLGASPPARADRLVLVVLALMR